MYIYCGKINSPAWFFTLDGGAFMITFSPDELWPLVCQDLVKKYSEGIFKTWIQPNKISEIEEKNNILRCTISAKSAFHISILEKSFKESIVSAIEEITQFPAEVVFQVGQQEAETEKKKKKSPTPPNSPLVDSLFSENSVQQNQASIVEQKFLNAGLNPAFTFETFAVSSTNEMAHAAAVAVSQNPGKAYNVLFLYGGVGVGKTHLMQASAQNIIRNNLDFTLLYRTGEEFMNEIVEALQNKKTIQLKQRYRSVKVLLIDDIQFMAGKRAMQEEFFHTFNAVLKTGGQVILTSDRPPHEIHPLDDRIQSRLEGGLTIDIQQPSFELRTAIVLIKAKQIQFPLPMDMAQKIASAVTSTRRLEGVVKALHSEHILRHQPVTMSLVETVLKGLNVEEDERQTLRAKPNEIIKTIANHYHIKLVDIKGPKRSKNIATARHLAMFILKQELDLPLVEIGRYFSNRDHTTVMHAVNKVSDILTKKEDWRINLQAIRTSLAQKYE